MKKLFTIMLLTTALAFCQNVSIAPAVNGGANGAAGPAGAISNVTGLTEQVSPGPVFCQGSTAFIAKTNLTVPDNSTSYVYFDCIRGQVVLATSPAPNVASQLNIATIVTAAAAISSATDKRIAGQFPLWTDGYFVVPPSACTAKSSGTLGTNHNTIQPDGASLTPALLASSTAAGASNTTLVCSIVLPSRISANRGAIINDVTVLYGVQTTALTSVGAPAISTITLPVAGLTETPSTVTPVAITGALTVTPVIGSANLGLTTAGAYFTEKVALGTPFALTSDLTLLYFSQVFAQSAAAAQIVNFPGLLVHYTLPIPA